METESELKFRVDLIERVTKLETKMNFIGVIAGASFVAALTLIVLFLTKG